MATFNINLKGLDGVIENLNVKKVNKRIQLCLNAFGQSVVTDAKLKVPKDEGKLASSIFVSKGDDLSITIGANVDYAAYVEFGTRKFADAYVAKLPKTWKDFAVQYKGKKGGDFGDFILRLVMWVKRKGLAGTYQAVTYDIKTKKASKIKRTGKRKDWDAEDVEVAYKIAFSILKNGIKPQPFLYPAFNNNYGQLLKDLENILN